MNYYTYTAWVRTFGYGGACYLQIDAIKLPEKWKLLRYGTPWQPGDRMKFSGCNCLAPNPSAPACWSPMDLQNGQPHIRLKWWAT